ncbi:MAG: hypothetical protein HOE90_13515 [Bacteriovoracaceae bacterium]|nr:hypothetical protein [Bacteriovoracaceae bacterium]
MKIIFSITIILFSSQLLFAAETDGYSSRYQPIESALPDLNFEVNRRIKHAIDSLNGERGISLECDWDNLASLLGDQLRRPFLGKIESFITSSKDLPKSKIDFDHSIYENVPLLHSFPIQVGLWLGIGFTVPIHHKGLLIGADKFGHFFDEGHYYYLLVHYWDFTFSKALDLGELLEYSFEGKLLGGVYSYADLAANYDGYRFWLDLLGSPKKKISSKYISCAKGNWKLSKSIDLDTYVSASWDEGMNCNEYRSSGMKEGIDKSVRILEKRDKRRYRCPVYPERVPGMISAYGEYSSHVINPTLLP